MFCDKCGAKMQTGASMCMRCGTVKVSDIEQIKENIKDIEIYEQEDHKNNIVFSVIFCVSLFLSICTLSISFSSIVKFFFSRELGNYTVVENILYWVQLIALPIVPVFISIIAYKLMKKNNLIDLKNLQDNLKK